MPIYAAVSAAKVNDITAAHAMPIKPDATYVFDLGYYDFAWWAQMHAKGCRIVTRLKSHTKLTVTGIRPVDAGGNILSDCIGFLPQRQAKSRRNPLSAPIREITLTISTGKTIRILTNDLKASAQEIAELYKRRWAIELFFRWVKQTLKIRHFLGNGQNAVRIQLAVALIAFLLLRLAQADQTAIASPLAFARLVRANLMHRRRIDRLITKIPIHSTTTNQMVFTWT
jgi:IS4 transposase